MSESHDYNYEREQQAARMRRKRAAGRDLIIPSIANIRRRRRALRDPEYFCRTYMEQTFYNPFTDDNRDMLRAIIERFKFGGNQAYADIRGGGKSSIAKGAIIYSQLKSIIRYTLYFDKNKDDATRRICSIMAVYEKSELLIADFPEVCIPILAIEGSPARGNMQTFNGRRTYLKWGEKFLRFANIPGSPVAGTILAPCALEKSRGKNEEDIRPDSALCDDIETRESVDSEPLTEDIEHAITDDIPGLAPKGKTITIVWLCTIMTPNCVSAKLTDRNKTPSWNGVRKCQLIEFPKNKDLWEQYIELCHLDELNGDNTTRTAHAFYLENRAAMDAGAKISDPFRFDGQLCHDGSMLQSSALEHCYQYIARNGWNSFYCEYQNNPPRDKLPETDDIALNQVMRAINGMPQGVCPENTDYLCAFIDVHARHIDWVVVAFAAGRRCVIDYGQDPVNSPNGNLRESHNQKALQDAIYSALSDWADKAATGWPEITSGELRFLDICLVDSGYQLAAVRKFCRDYPGNVFRPSIGEGSRKDQSKFTPPAKRSEQIKIGRSGHYYAKREGGAGGRVWVYHIDTDFCKRSAQQGFLLQPTQFAALTLFGKTPIQHRNYAQHICAEIWTEKHTPGRGMEYFWDERSRRNHWLDATAGCIAGAIILGLPIISPDTERRDTAQEN